MTREHKCNELYVTTTYILKATRYVGHRPMGDCSACASGFSSINCLGKCRAGVRRDKQNIVFKLIRHVKR